MGTLLLAAVLLGIATPHALRRRELEPSAGAVLWIANLTVRAIAGLLVALYLVLYVPSTELFATLTHWCWHPVLPLLAAHLGLNGHWFGDAAAMVPTLVLAVSVAWGAMGLFRVARSVRRLVRAGTLGRGPRDSLIVGGPEVVVAAAGLSRPRVLVSTGALTHLDDEELAASLDHERGHIARRHRWVLAYAQACRALGIFIPGTRAAVAELNLHLERDADRYALARRHDRLALASAILKAAGVVRPSAALSALGGPVDPMTRRLSDLLEGPARGRSRTPALMVAGCLALALATAASVPPVIAAGLDRAAPTGLACQD